MEPATRHTVRDRQGGSLCETRTRMRMGMRTWMRLHSAKLISIEWLIPTPIQRIIWIINVRNSFAWKTQNAKWKMKKEKNKSRKRRGKTRVLCLGFKSANPISHTAAEWLRGWDFYNQISTECSHTRAVCVCVAQIFWRIVFLLPKTPDAFWHCFLLFFMIICIHQFCIDSPTPSCLLCSPKTPGERINTDTHTQTYIRI